MGATKLTKNAIGERWDSEKCGTIQAKQGAKKNLGNEEPGSETSAGSELQFQRGGGPGI